MIIDRTSRIIAEVHKLNMEKEIKNGLNKSIVLMKDMRFDICRYACKTNLHVITKQTTKTAAVNNDKI